MKILLIILCIFIFPSITYSEEDSCFNIEIYDDENIKIDYLEIIPKNYRKFKLTQLKNLVSLEDDLGKNLHFSKKLKFNSKIIVFFSNELICELNAKIRMHGDGRDHYDLIDGDIFSSMDVEILNGNIFNSVKFKLFLPKAEGGSSEIFNSVLFRELNFLAPETKYLNVKIGDKNIQYLYQDSLSKEMLEKNYRREGPIIEADEENTFGLMRIQNKKWVSLNTENSGEILGVINKEMAALKNNFYINLQKEIHSNSLINYSILSNNNLIHYNNLSDFVLLGLATGSEHMFSFNDMRFYYDMSYGVYYPIYYDGEPNSNYQNISMPKNISKYINLDVENLIKKLNNIDMKLLNTKLRKFGLNESNNYTSERVKLIKNNLRNLVNKNKISISDDSYNFENLEKYFKNKNIYVVYQEKENNFLTCKFFKKDCSISKFTEEEKIDLIRQRYKKNYKLTNKPQYTFFGTQQNLTKNQIRGIYSWSQKVIQDNAILFSLNTNIKIDYDEKKIELNYQDSNSRAVIGGNESFIKSWKIILNGKKRLNGKDNLIDKETNLTGCLTFLDIIVEDIEIIGKDLHCEDSVNFIRSNGSVKKIDIINSFSDAIDMDFSNLRIDTINIDNSKNDCIDFSFGNYKINNLIANNCGDKGVSVGEKSIVKIDDFTLRNSIYGAVSKDSSTLYIENANLSNLKYCVAAYNKKNEFTGAVLKIKNIICNNFHNKIFKDNFSKIILG